MYAVISAQIGLVAKNRFWSPALSAVVAQLVEGSAPIPEIRSSNPGPLSKCLRFVNFPYSLNRILNNNGKRGREQPILKKHGVAESSHFYITALYKELEITSVPVYLRLLEARVSNPRPAVDGLQGNQSYFGFFPKSCLLRPLITASHKAKVSFLFST